MIARISSDPIEINFPLGMKKEQKESWFPASPLQLEYLLSWDNLARYQWLLIKVQGSLETAQLKYCQSSVRQRLFPFSKRSLSLLTIDATIGKMQVWSPGLIIGFDFLSFLVETLSLTGKKFAKFRKNGSDRLRKGQLLRVLVTKSPFLVCFKVVCCRAPFNWIAVCGTVVIQLASELERKHTAIPARIPSMRVQTTFAFLWKIVRPPFGQ